MGRIYRRHKEGNWYADYTTPEGRRVQGSLRTKDKRVARERLRLAELGATPASRGKKQRLIDAIDGMVGSLHNKAEGTRAMYREKGRRLLKSLGNPFVTDVNSDMLDKYIKLRQSEDPIHGGATDHTIQKELITVRRALKHAVKRKMLHEMPGWVEFSANYQPKQTWLTIEQFEALCLKMDTDHRKLWVSLAALGGMRAGEVERLSWAMVHFDENRIHVPGTKTLASKRRVPMAPSLRARLLAVPVADRVGLVVGAWGNVRRDLHAACVRADVPKVSPNDLRRTFGSWLVQKGHPLLTIAGLMGHSSTRMLELVYGKPSSKNYEDAIASLDAGQGVTDGVTESVALRTTRDTSGHNHEGSDAGSFTDEEPS